MIAEGRQDGPTVVIMGAVHPDETAGTELVSNLPATLDIKRGRVVAVLANLDAMPTRARQSDVNMNRSFRPETIDEKLRKQTDLPRELRRTQQLIDLFDAEKPASMLDLHQYESPLGLPNIITDRESLVLARAVGARAIVFGFNLSEPGGSDDYAHRHGIRGLCYELGPMGNAFQKRNVRLGKQVIERFLAAEGLTDQRVTPLFNDPIIAETTGEQIVTQSDDFKLILPDAHWFNPLPPNTLVAMDGDRPLRTDPKKEQALMFIKDHVVRGREPYAPVNILKA